MGYLVVRAGINVPRLIRSAQGKVKIKRVSKEGFEYEGEIPVREWDLYKLNGEPYWWHGASIKVKIRSGSLLLMRETQDIIGIQNGSPEIIPNDRMCKRCHRGNTKKTKVHDRRTDIIHITYQCLNPNCRFKRRVERPLKRIKLDIYPTEPAE